MNERLARTLGPLVATGSLAGALAIGGGLPPSPATMLSAARSAADNVAVAASNLERAERDTRALARIARNVASQLDSSERLLETQLAIEQMSRRSLERSQALNLKIAQIDREIGRLGSRLRAMSRLATATGGQAEGSAAVAGRLQHALDDLEDRFQRLIDESRELNRKARGYEEFRDGPG